MVIESRDNSICFLLIILRAGNLYRIDADRLGHWLCERQLPSGGLNGRPEKLPDVCYSWWVVSSLHMIGRAHWIDSKALKSFILACQVRIVYSDGHFSHFRSSANL